MSLFTGKLVALTAARPEQDAAVEAGWWRDAEFIRLLDADVARPLAAGALQKELEAEPKPSTFPFQIRTLADDRLIGFTGVWVDVWPHGDGWVGIGLGDRAVWGQGYGTDAMRVVLRYAFTELNLHRVSLGVFGYNARAIRSYQKAGFQVEGRLRETLLRDGRRWDELRMGILRREWEALHASGEE